MADQSKFCQKLNWDSLMGYQVVRQPLSGQAGVPFHPASTIHSAMAWRMMVNEIAPGSG